jgi:hypothetical protein
MEDEMRSFLLAAAMTTTALMLLPVQSEAATSGAFETLQTAAKEAGLVEPAAACVRRRVCGPRGCVWRTVCGGRRW